LWDIVVADREKLGGVADGEKMGVVGDGASA
jgi:hypothetical protein